MTNNKVMTIQEIVEQRQIPLCEGTENNTKELEPRTLYGKDIWSLKVDPAYQRTISPGRIIGYGQLNPQHLTAAIIAERPNGDLYLIDGQNKACIYRRSVSMSVGFNCLVYVHDKDTPIGECRKIEAKIFKNINENLKSLSTLQKIRSGVVFGDPESCWIERVMIELKLTVDGFGSDDPNALQLKNFNQFEIMVSKEFPEGTNGLLTEERLETLRCGLELYKTMWEGDPTLKNNKNPYIQGNILKGCVLTHTFKEDVLRNGQVGQLNSFLNWNHLQGFTNTKTVNKQIGADGNSARRYLHDVVLHGFNIWASNSSLAKRECIGEKTLDTKAKFGKKYLPVGV